MISSLSKARRAPSGKRRGYGSWGRRRSGWWCAAVAAGILATALSSGCGGGGDGGGAGAGSGETAVDAEDATAPVDMTVLKRLKGGLYTHTWEMPDASRIDFVLYVPPDLEGKNEKVPLVLALHFGAPRFTRFFAQPFVQQLILPTVNEMPAIVVAPDVIDGTWTNERCETAVMSLMREIAKTYPIDEIRVLVTGYSLGGRGAWYFASRHPDFFTAAIPMAGAPPEEMPDPDVSIPVYCIHSNADEVFPVGQTRAAVETLRKRGVPIEIQELEQISHYDSGRYIDSFRTAMKWVAEQWDAKTGAADEAPADGN